MICNAHSTANHAIFTDTGGSRNPSIEEDLGDVAAYPGRSAFYNLR